MATCYVSSLATGGGVGSLADPWTLQEAADSAAAGDDVMVMDDGTYSLSSRLEFNTGQGLSHRIAFFAANSNGVVDGSRVTLDGGGSLDNLLITLTDGLNLYFSGFDFTGATDKTIDLSFYTNGSRIIFDNCRFTGSPTYHVYSREGFNGFRFSIIRSSFTGATAYALANQADNLLGKVIGCRIFNNGGGVSTTGSTDTEIDGCLIYNNTGPGIDADGSFHARITNCVISGNGGDGVSAAGVDRMSIRETIFSNNGGYAVNTGAGLQSNFEIFRNNCFYNNASGPVDINGGNPFGEDNILADPLFVSTVDGSEDFRLQPDSPCIGAGINPPGYGS